MKKIILSAFVLAGMLFTSCNDDDNITDDGTVDVSKMYLPSKIVSEDYTTTFTYNNKGQLTKIVESDGYEYTFSYNGSQLVEFVEKDSGGKTTYTFTQSGTTITLKMIGEYGTQKYEDTGILIVDATGNLINDGYFTYSYDANGNITKMTGDEGEVTFTFDSKNGIFKNLNLPKWVSTYILENQTNLVNNVLSISIISKEDPEDNFSGTVKYEYNADSYPLKMESLSSSNEIYSQSIEYTKK